MRLIDADKLYPNCLTKDGTLAISQSQIANAPTVEPEITNDDLQAAMTESYHLGYELAETKFKRPHGKWIKQDWGYICSECNETNDYAYDNNIHKFTDNFCPNCGADMRGEQK